MRTKKTKFIFVTGGVVSSLGKGLASASIGALLENRGLDITLVKLDPYINVDPGTMSPFQHGEVFVTEDGAETDLDLGHYERFVDENLSRNASHSAGASRLTTSTRRTPRQRARSWNSAFRPLPVATDRHHPSTLAFRRSLTSAMGHRAPLR